MIGNSCAEYIFINVAIFLLRAVGPLSILYILTSIIRPSLLFWSSWLVAVEVYCAAEAAFFLLVYAPLKFHLQHDAVHPSPTSKEERAVLFTKCVRNIWDFDEYLQRWFLDAPLQEIKRENFREYLAWAFLSKRCNELSSDENEELGEYIGLYESTSGRKLEDGWGSAKCIRGTFDRVPMQHRPLIWYLVSFCLSFPPVAVDAFQDGQLRRKLMIIFAPKKIVSLVELVSDARLRLNGWQFYRFPLRTFFFYFPLRPLAFFTSHVSCSRKLSYWYREHKSKDRLPILYIHGTGIGIFPYVDFMNEIARGGRRDNDDEEIGMMVIEIMAISSRICPAAPLTNEMRVEVQKILDLHSWTTFALMGNS
jgi:hypothetical protein